MPRVSVAALPLFVELVVGSGPSEGSPATDATSGVEIVIADVMIRAEFGADEGLLKPAIQAARMSVSSCSAKMGR